MNSVLLIVIIIFALAVIAALIVVIIKNLAAPKKIGSVRKLIKEGKYQAAQRVAKTAITKNARDYVAHYWLGEAYLADGKPELAFVEFKTVNENAVFDGSISEIEFRTKMADLYVKYNQNQDALKEYLLLTKMQPQNGDNYYNVGKIYENLNQAPNALGFYQKAVVLNKKNDKAHTALGYLLYRGKQFQEAKKEIDIAIKLCPENYSNFYYLGKILKENKDYSGAVKAFEKAEHDQSFRQRALIERGTCYMAVDQGDNAIGEFEHAISISKDDGAQETLFARYFLAACYEKSHKIDKAIEQWDKIYSKNRTFRDVGAKLNEYRDLQTNDSMKEYLTASPTDFVEICKKIAMAGFNLQSQKTEPTPYGCSMYATEVKKDSWMNVRPQFFLAVFYRNAEPLEDSVVRKVAESLKNQNCSKGVIFSSSGFTNSASKYAENRSVVLVNKEQLEGILSKAGI